MPAAQAGEVKQIDEIRVLAVEKDASHPNIASVFADLVDYYNNGDLAQIEAMEIVFPQMGIRYRNGDVWIAIEFQGRAKADGKVQIRNLPGGRFYATDYIGPYQKLDEVVDDAFDSLYAAGHRPDESRPIRLLYWNSPDDTPVNDLRTEILIPLQ